MTVNIEVESHYLGSMIAVTRMVKIMALANIV